MLRTLKLMLVLALATTLIFSCKQDLLDNPYENALDQENPEFRKGNNDNNLFRLSTVREGASLFSVCDITVCIDIQPDSSVPNAPYRYSVELPGLPTVLIQNGIVFPNGIGDPTTSFPLPDPFCVTLTIDGSTPLTIAYQGPGAVTTTVTYPDMSSEVIFQAGNPNDQISTSISEDLLVSCDGTISNDPCEIEVCIQLFGDQVTGNQFNTYTVSLPGLPDVVITGGMIFPNGLNGLSFPLPADGQFCTPPIEVQGEVPVTISFQGPGAVETTVNYPNSSEVIFQAGNPNDQQSTSVSESFQITCEGSEPIEPCEIEVCIQLTGDFVTGNQFNTYTVSLPGLPDVVITGGMIFPNGLGGTSFPLPPNGQFCTPPIEVLGEVPVTLSFQGPGAVATTVIWSDTEDCEIFQAGNPNDQQSTSVSEDFIISCHPNPC